MMPETVTHASAHNLTMSKRLSFSPLIGPDLLDLSGIGVAGSLRGRVVRGFFWVMRWWAI
jgi:hypothetical protein